MSLKVVILINSSILYIVRWNIIKIILNIINIMNIMKFWILYEEEKYKHALTDINWIPL